MSKGKVKDAEQRAASREEDRPSFAEREGKPSEAGVPAESGDELKPRREDQSDRDAPGAPPRAAEPREGAADPEALQSRVAELQEKLLRARADFQNFQRRAAIDRAEAVRYANADVMRSLVTVIDDFERCIQAAQSTDNLAAVVEGVRLVYENLRKALGEHGLEAIDALHRPFDPTIHEAMMQQESADHPPGTVVEEIARGYRLRDRVIRPSKVVVSKRPAEADERTRGGDDVSSAEGELRR